MHAIMRHWKQLWLQRNGHKNPSTMIYQATCLHKTFEKSYIILALSQEKLPRKMF